MKDETYKLEKSYWTENDFEDMGWHDCKIHGLSFDSNNERFKSDFIFDIDYILKWVKPEKDNKYFTFWISPCTLIFHNVFGLNADFDWKNYLSLEIEIYELKMIQKGPGSKYKVEIETSLGIIAFEASGFEQFVRKAPKHIQNQWFNLEERGGISFN